MTLDHELLEQLAKAAWDAYMGYVTRVPWEQLGPFRQERPKREIAAVFSELEKQGYALAKRQD